MKTTKLVLALSFAAWLAACGDNNDPPADVDGGITADAEVTPRSRAVVVAGDFVAAGVMTELDIETLTTEVDVAPAAIGNDPVLRKHGSELFVVNRTSNNVTILDANDYSLVEQLGTGAASNPQDVAVDGNKIFVAVYGEKGLIEMTRGSSTITPIDLSAGDPDGKPNCASVYKVGGKLFVTCQLLNDTAMLATRGLNGKVYVVDIATRAIDTSFDLTTKNPFSLLEQLPAGAMHAGDLIVGTVDFTFGANNAGCIERISTGATPAAGGCMINNTALAGGFASRLEISNVITTSPSAHVIPGPTLFTLVARADFSGGDVRTVDLIGEELTTAAYTDAAQAISDVAVCQDGTVVVAENPPFGAPANAPQGLRVYTGAGVERTNAALRIGLKPTSSRGLACFSN